MASFLGLNISSRGIRNNNPGNIKIVDANKWKGKLARSQNTDKTFEQFTTVEYGIRAMMVLLSNYYNKNGLNTVGKIIGKWAPAGSENPHQSNYIAHVVKRIPIKGLTANTVINLNDQYLMCELCLAMSEFENLKKDVDQYLNTKHFEDAYLLFKGNTTISEVTSGIATPQSGKIGSILTIVALAVLTVIAIKS